MSDSFVTLLTIAHQAPLSTGLPRKGYWSGLPFPSPRDLPNSGIKPTFPELAGRFFTLEPPGKSRSLCTCWKRTEINPWYRYIDYLHLLKIHYLKNSKFKNILSDGPLLLVGSITHVSGDDSFPIISYPRNSYL